MAKYEPSHLKVMNTKVVYQEFLKKEALFVKEISRNTKISVPTVMKIVDFLIEKELISEQECTITQVGRTPHMFGLNKDKYFSIGMIYEGDFLHIGMVNLAGHVFHMIQVQCNQQYEVSAFQNIDRLLSTSDRNPDDLIGIGFGMHGVFNEKTREIIAPVIGLEQPKYIGGFIDALSEKYKVKVAVDNDTNVQAFGEYLAKTENSSEDMIYIYLGTGLGSGIILNGKIRHGARNHCGEIGYMIFECDEKESGAGWLEKRINVEALAKNFGISESDNDPHKKILAIDYVSNYLAMAINNIVFSFDIEDVVLDGSVITFLGDSVLEEIQHKLNKIAYKPVTVRKKSVAFPGLSGGGILASNLWLEEVFKR